MQTSKEAILSPQRFTDEIRRHPDFLRNLPKTDFRESPIDERRAYVQRAMASGALSISRKLEADHGAYDLSSNLYGLVSHLQRFADASRIMNKLESSSKSPRNMSREEKALFYESKAEVIEFNHALREVINAGAATLGFDELLTFMTNMYAVGNGQAGTEEFYRQARARLTGMRNEMAFEQMLIANGIEYEIGDPEQDAKGGDFIIDGVAIDVKSSEGMADLARQKAARNGYDPRTIIWSHINSSDFDGRLTLSYDRSNELFTELKPDLDAAVTSQRASQPA